MNLFGKNLGNRRIEVRIFLFTCHSKLASNSDNRIFLPWENKSVTSNWTCSAEPAVDGRVRDAVVVLIIAVRLMAKGFSSVSLVVKRTWPARVPVELVASLMLKMSDAPGLREETRPSTRE